MAAVVGALGLLLSVATTSANAASYESAKCWTQTWVNPDPNKCIEAGHGSVATAARYFDSTNNACAVDEKTDGNSAVTVVWPEGHYERRTLIWEHNGRGEGTCANVNAGEGARYAMKSCVGSWSFWPAQRKVISCGTTTTFRR
ncbi:hypothetical protein [Kribbella sindirgiensis]|uniref:Uncharacterized protein n=1 Tax=Kribbella sindirgiensis TaxID=1124744 RepID=A0A4V2M3I2_9ACTN|nr:hypothetical protein [Kribbella sindirgiensis]TCC32162.1 hypothetical protein E0H50_18210 [Kribbella sindirgiensis]